MSSLIEKTVKCYYQKKYAEFINEKLAGTKLGATLIGNPKKSLSASKSTTTSRENSRDPFDHRMPNDPTTGGTSSNLAAMQSPRPRPASEVGPMIKTKSMMGSLPKPASKGAV